MFDEEPGRRARWIAGIGLILLTMAAFATHFLIGPAVRSQRAAATTSTASPGSEAELPRAP